MREIKFRAWDKERNEYLSAGQVLIAITAGRNPKSNPQYLDILTNPDYWKGRFVLEQFTGLKDKNGREIYEGDIVRCWKKHSHIDEARDELVEGYATAVIKANGWTFFFEVIKQDDPRGWFFYGPEADEFYGVCTDYETMEVIGNIYENPELLGPTAGEDGGVLKH